MAISGVCELAGTVGIHWPRTRRIAGIGLLLLIVALFPANVNMALHPDAYPAFSPWLLYARLPLQVVWLAWVLVADASVAAIGVLNASRARTACSGGHHYFETMGGMKHVALSGSVRCQS